MKNSICEFFGVVYTTNHGDYHGLPSIVGRNKYEIFSFIKEKAFRILHGWRHKLLARARKEILLKSIVQAIPFYVMRVFIIPHLLCVDLDRRMNSFWWGKTGENIRGLRWHRWDKLTFHKAEGGLGFRKIHE